MTQKSRRTILQAILGTTLAPFLPWGKAQGASLLVEQLRKHPEDHGDNVHQTSYRADATILLLSLPIYKRRGAGGGSVAVQRENEGDRDTLSIRFTAGSYPEQARGLNRLGYIEEVVVSRANHVEELAYFGFMTSSPEKDVNEAKRAMEASGGAVTYSTAEGHIYLGMETSRKAKLNLIDQRTWTQAETLRELIRGEFLNNSETETQTRRRAGVPATFLYSLLSATWGKSNTFEASYSYLGKDYRITAEKELDPDTGRSMAEEGLTHLPESVFVLKGTIQEVGKNKWFRFRLWAEDTGRPELPIRFEYRPRAFLRVSFERASLASNSA